MNKNVVKLSLASIFTASALASPIVMASHHFSNIGTIAPYETIYITSETTGVVKDVSLDIGDKANVDDRLVLIDSIDHKHNLELSLLNLQQSKAELSYQQDRFDRISKLRKTNNASQSELDDVTFELEKAEISVRQKEVDYQIKMKDHDRTEITVPLDSFIIDRSVDVGQFVQPSTVLFELVDSSRLKVKTHASASEVKEISVGDKVSVLPTINNESQPIDGVVTNIGISFSNDMSAYPVIIEIPFSKSVNISETVSVKFNEHE